MKAHFLTVCVLVAYSNIAQADTIETMRMYDKSLSSILVEAARNGSFTDLEKIGHSIGIPELAREINRTTDHAMRNCRQFSGTYYVNQDAYQQYGIHSISFSEWPSVNGKVKQLHFTFHTNRCPLPPVYYEQFTGNRSLTAYLDDRYITVLSLPTPSTAKLFFTKDRTNKCGVIIVQEFAAGKMEN